jgi:hypothetical protein
MNNTIMCPCSSILLVIQRTGAADHPRHLSSVGWRIDILERYLNTF